MQSSASGYGETYVKVFLYMAALSVIEPAILKNTCCNKLKHFKNKHN